MDSEKPFWPKAMLAKFSRWALALAAATIFSCGFEKFRRADNPPFCRPSQARRCRRCSVYAR